MKSKIPKIKKKVNAFLVGEEGKISKQSLLKAGAILSSIAVATILSSRPAVAGIASHSEHGSHSNLDPDTLSLNYSQSSGEATATHNSHAQHGSHNSHCSHGSW